MSTTPTPEEVRDALATLARAHSQPKRISAAKVQSMTADEVASALEDDPHAFDHITEDGTDS